MSALTKVQALLARALDQGASEEERRTSAVIACRLIRDHGLLGRSSEPVIRYVYVNQQPQPAQPTSVRRRVIVSKYSGRCSECASAYEVGHRIAWAKGQGTVCFDCHRGARAA